MAVVLAKCLEIEGGSLIGGRWVFSVLARDGLSFGAVETRFEQKDDDDYDESEHYEEHEFDETFSFVICF